MLPIRTLIVDDEAHARARIRHALKDEPASTLAVPESEMLDSTHEHRC